MATGVNTSSPAGSVGLPINAQQAMDKDLKRFSVKDKRVIEQCILNYSQPDHCSGWFGYLLFRIWNAIKSIFGCSDWQKTVTFMADKSFVTNFKDIQKTPKLKPHLQKFVDNQKRFASLWSPLCSTELEFWVDLQERADKDATSWNNRLEKMGEELDLKFNALSKKLDIPEEG